jgi:hypothetical protein
MRLGLRRPAYWEQYACALHHMPEADFPQEVEYSEVTESISLEAKHGGIYDP